MKEFNKLSKRQQNILKYMDRYMEDNGFPPTIREIGTATDINSTSVVNYNLNKAGAGRVSGTVGAGLTRYPARGQPAGQAQEGREGQRRVLPGAAGGADCPLVSRCRPTKAMAIISK